MKKVPSRRRHPDSDAAAASNPPPKVNETGRRSATAFTDNNKQIRMTEILFYVGDPTPGPERGRCTSIGFLSIMPSVVQHASKMSMVGRYLLKNKQNTNATAVTPRKINIRPSEREWSPNQGGKTPSPATMSWAVSFVHG